MCVQRFDDSLNSAIHITYRISLRSSSMWEPRDPLLKVLTFLFLMFRRLFLRKRVFAWFLPPAGRSQCPGGSNREGVHRGFWLGQWREGAKRGYTPSASRRGILQPRPQGNQHMVGISPACAVRHLPRRVSFSAAIVYSARSPNPYGWLQSIDCTIRSHPDSGLAAKTQGMRMRPSQLARPGPTLGYGTRQCGGVLHRWCLSPHCLLVLNL